MYSWEFLTVERFYCYHFSQSNFSKQNNPYRNFLKEGKFNRFNCLPLNLVLSAALEFVNGDSTLYWYSLPFCGCCFYVPFNVFGRWYWYWFTRYGTVIEGKLYNHSVQYCIAQPKRERHRLVYTLPGLCTFFVPF